MMHQKIRALVLSAVAPLLLASCKDSTGPDGQAVWARAQWQANGPPSYEYVITRSCYCPTEVIGPVTVVVKNGVVESRRYTETNNPVAANYVQFFPAVEGLFLEIESAHAKKVAQMHVNYDPQYGYPTRIDVDVAFNMADDEYTYLATAFVVK